MTFTSPSLAQRTQAAVDAAKGRWPAIFTSCGMDESHFGRRGHPCPVCGGTDRFSFTNRWGRGNFICRGCGSGDGFDLISRYCQCGFIEALEIVERFCGIVWQGQRADARVELSETELKEKEQARERMALWAQAKPLREGDPVWKYLSGRGIDPRSAGFEIRCHPALEYRDGEGGVSTHPAMLSRVIDRHGVAVNLHRTYLTEDGRKADVASPKKLLPGSVKGASVHIGGPVGNVLALAEGIETALAVHLMRGIPVWATLGCVNLADFEYIPARVERLLIFADNDAKFAGQAAAYAAAHRFAVKSGRQVNVLVPECTGCDWLDVFTGKGR
jgi:hypothetical protein